MLHVFQSLLSCNCTHLEISFTPKYPYFCVNNIFMLLGAIVNFKIDFFYCIYHNNTKPYENKIKSFQKFYIFAIQGSQDTCSYLVCTNA